MINRDKYRNHPLVKGMKKNIIKAHLYQLLIISLQLLGFCIFAFLVITPMAIHSLFINGFSFKTILSPILVPTGFLCLIDLLYLACLSIKLIQFKKRKIVLGQVTYVAGRDPIEYLGEHTPIINDNPHFVRIDGQAFFVSYDKIFEKININTDYIFAIYKDKILDVVEANKFIIE